MTISGLKRDVQIHGAQAIQIHGAQAMHMHRLARELHWPAKKSH